MKEIKLTQNKIASVDDEDYEYLNQWKWYAFKRGHTYYVVRHISYKDKLIFMHRLIMKPDNGMEVDHIDHNGLNNQKANLRNCSHAENSRNKSATGSSKYLGVAFAYKNGHTYIKSMININGRNTHLGIFKTEELAAHKYDEMAKIHHGEFANLNFK